MASSRKSPSKTDPVAAVQHMLAARVMPGQRVLLAFSGGLDSSVLLHVLHGLAKQLDFELLACHVNHHLHPRADDWQAHCQSVAQTLAIPFFARHAQVPRDSGDGLESAARTLRWREISVVAGEQRVQWVVSAHHQDDQAETLLLNLVRGAGVLGAAAMQAIGKLPAIDRADHVSATLLRPLLDVSRQTLQGYAQLHNLRWVDDTSNAEIEFSRNFLRAEVFPVLNQRWPGAAKQFSQATRQFAQAQTLLDELAQIDLAAARPAAGQAVAGSEASLCLPPLLALTEERFANALRYWLREVGLLQPSAAWLHECWAQCADSALASTPQLSLGGRIFVRYRKMLALLPPLPKPFRSFPETEYAIAPQIWQGEAELFWPIGCVRFVPAHVHGVSPEQKPVLRARAAGDRYRAHAGAPSRSLKNVLQEAGVPAALRPWLPVLAIGNEVIWMPFLNVGCAVISAPVSGPVCEPIWVGSGLMD